MEDVKTFLEERTKEIEPTFEKATNMHWDATITGDQEAYEQLAKTEKEFTKIFNKKENFEKIKTYMKNEEIDKKTKRELEVLFYEYLGSQGDQELLDNIIELGTKIQEKFNNFRTQVGEKRYTENEVEEILKVSTENNEVKKLWEATKKQGALVEKEVIELVKLRNKLAKSLGYNNYFILALETKEEKTDQIIAILDELDEISREAFVQLKQEIDTFLSKKFNTLDLKPWHYGDLFCQRGPKIYEVNMDQFYKKDILSPAKSFYKNIGLEVEEILARSDLYEKEGKNQHAYCIDMDRKGDIRSLMNIKNNDKWMETVLHELGHGVYWRYIDKNLPFMLRECSHFLTTEAIALLFGRQSKNAHFIKQFTDPEGKDMDSIKDKIQKSLRLQELIFSRWAQVLVRFEKALYENPDQDLNKVWWDLVKKYQLIDFSRNEPDWASKIHIACYPCYYQDYVLGNLFASQINHYIIKNILHQEDLKNPDYANKKEIGDYLKEKIFFPGKTLDWNQLIEFATGEKLNPKYWKEEFC